MTEHVSGDEEERAWAVRTARAFLAPQASGGRRQTTEEGTLNNAAVVLVAVVPLAGPAEEALVSEEEDGHGHLE